MSVRPPKNLSNTLSFKSGVIKTGANVLDAEVLGEKAYSLGLAATSVEKALTRLEKFTGTETERTKLLQTCGEAVHAYFVQRELIGFTDHTHPIAHYSIPKDVLGRVGIVPKSMS